MLAVNFPVIHVFRSSQTNTKAIITLPRTLANHRLYFRKNCDTQDPEKTSLVDSALLPKIQPSTLLDNERPNLNNDPESDRTLRGSAVRQVLAAVVAQLGTINTGMAFGFSAIALPQLQEPDSIIPIKEGSTEESWIGTWDSESITKQVKFVLCVFILCFIFLHARREFLLKLSWTIKEWIENNFATF